MTASVFDLHAKLARGDVEAVGEVLELLLPRLRRLAHRVLRGRDAEDAVQSAVRTYLRRAKAGQFPGLADVDELRRLLATITCRKALKQLRKRSRTVNEASLLSPVNSDAGSVMATLAAVLPSQEFDLMCQQWLDQLGDPSLQKVAVLAFCGYSQAEIAEQLGCTTRNVRFKLTRIRQIWQKILESERP